MDKLLASCTEEQKDSVWLVVCAHQEAAFALGVAVMAQIASPAAVT